MHGVLLDIPRLCRALAIPGDIASQFIEAEKNKRYIDRLDEVKHISNQISDVLRSYLYLKNRNASNELIASIYLVDRNWPYMTI
jgi:hypothetical protein